MVHRDDPLQATSQSARSHMDHAGYAQTERLCQDFGLRIVVSHEGAGGFDQGAGSGSVDCSAPAVSNPSQRRFALAADHGETPTRLTPFFQTLMHLESYVTRNLVDILHQYFFEEGDLEEQESQMFAKAGIIR